MLPGSLALGLEYKYETSASDPYIYNYIYVASKSDYIQTRPILKTFSRFLPRVLFAVSSLEAALIGLQTSREGGRSHLVFIGLFWGLVTKGF